ncbi:sirohydrochlorin chelatase [Streptomyces tsukubensis]|uniref:Cobalamin biosynthesis protein CbiX n=1 Tax=Streptomyces tsukubensis TaxID=83656 RepID=A0A1V4AF70_9ACTN|nr:CbiX/SirB N-terminal domain-containing protein [Streptomyces tsukubensis]OON82689.1 hypothetical protein B1H18_01135 [Streptomyces tsukubensis]QFR92139.1 sirohydrochlorin chelatase [Streptomyces tsukubensis]
MTDRRRRAAAVVLVVHGTRLPSGVTAAHDLAARLTVRLGTPEPVRLAFADLRPPNLTETLTSLPARRTVTVVPAFLASGFHVRSDVPEQLLRAARPVGATTLTSPLGPDPSVVDALVARLAEAGARPGDAVVLAAAGSARAAARAEVTGVAAELARRLGRGPIPVAWAAGPRGPSPEEAVAAARRGGARRVAVATWLLTPGLFADRLHRAGADLVAAPLGTHPGVVDALARRATEVPALVA